MLVIALSLILLVRAITQDDGNGDAERATTTTTAEESSTSTTLRTLSPGLGAARLTLDDLPAGWEASPVGEVDELCEESEPLASVEPDERTEVGFAQVDLGLSLSQVVLDFTSSARAEDLLGAVRDGLERCEDIENESGTFHLEEVDADDLGDEAVGVHVSGDTDLGGVEAHLLYIRVRDRVTTLVLVGVAPVDEDIVFDAAEKVVSRL